jgi:protein O-GlcNAc transferase
MNRKQRRAAKNRDKAPPIRPAPPRPAASSRQTAEQFTIAHAHHQAGRLVEAERLYRQICAADPYHVHSLHFLGVLAGQAGRNDIAIDLIGRALALKPDYAEAHFNLGNVLAKENRLDQAAAHYQRVLPLKPDSAEAHNSLGTVLLDQGKSREAMACFARSLALKPDFVEALCNQGLALAKESQLDDAVMRYRRALALKPDFAEAHNGLGAVLLDQGDPMEAIFCFEQALALKPGLADAHYNLGLAFTKDNRLYDAATHYERALALQPNNPHLHYSLGNVLKEQRRLSEALTRYERALALAPDFAEAHNGLGFVFLGQGKSAEAMACFGRALELKPNFAEAHNGMGAALVVQDRSNEAIACLDRALALKPKFADALNNRGVALLDLERPGEALASLDHALALKPDFADALNNRGVALLDLKRPEEALTSLDKALALKPDFADALNNCGVALLELKRPYDALGSFDRALAINPNLVDALNNRADALRNLERYAEALEAFDKALAIAPDHRYAFGGLADTAFAICDWTRTAVLASQLEHHIKENRSIITPFTLLGCSGDESLQLECARRWIDDKVPVVPQPLWNGDVWHHEKIRIGYLSADFHEHATALLLAGLIEIHDRARFEIIGISFGPDDHSDMRTRLVRAFDQFHDVRRKRDSDVAKLINDLHVEIAVDLKGYTRDSRPGILAHRPAPIQVSYLGYPGTMGCDFIDYMIADKSVLPFERQPFYSEKIVHLPECYQVNDLRRKSAPQAPTRQEAGLPDKGFVFCCFNNTYKIAPPVFDVWMRLLGAVEGSVLWLYRDNGAAEHNLRKEAAARGIDPARIVFASRVAHDQHLARHRLADLFLDTLPCNAHTTASDALWAELPLVTCRGGTFAGRVAASLLQAIGLPDLVTHNLDAYEALALRLATDPSLLRGFKERLKQNRLVHPLFDSDRYRRHIESAYETMWGLWQRGESPRSFAVDPLRGQG